MKWTLITQLLPLVDMNEKYQKALNNLYKDHGVGDTDTHKIAFWESLYKPISSDSYLALQQRVAVYELSWLDNTFPEDIQPNEVLRAVCGNYSVS